MQIIIPMAGKGSRFLAAGYQPPKPLIEVAGRPMIEHVIRLFPGTADFVFLCRDEHLRTSNLKEVLLQLKPAAKILEVHPEGTGPVPNIIKAGSLIEDSEPVIVSYCDFNLHWDFENFKGFIKSRDPASAAVCYKGFHPHLLGPNLYAGVRVDDNLNTLEVKEKHSFTENKMDTWQQAGLFYFQTGALLKKYCSLLVNKNIRCNGEYYVSLLFNLIIKDGLSSVIYPVEYFCQWGTPEDLKEWQVWHAFFSKAAPDSIPQDFPSELVRNLRFNSPDELKQAFVYWQNYFVQTRDD